VEEELSWLMEMGQQRSWEEEEEDYLEEEPWDAVGIAAEIVVGEVLAAAAVVVVVVEEEEDASYQHEEGLEVEEEDGYLVATHVHDSWEEEGMLLEVEEARQIVVADEVVDVDCEAIRQKK